jgi:hypothetical protein
MVVESRTIALLTNLLVLANTFVGTNFKEVSCIACFPFYMILYDVVK